MRKNGGLGGGAVRIRHEIQRLARQVQTYEEAAEEGEWNHAIDARGQPAGSHVNAAVPEVQRTDIDGAGDAGPRGSRRRFANSDQAGL